MDLGFGNCRVGCSLLQRLGVGVPGSPVAIASGDSTYLCRAWLAKECNAHSAARRNHECVCHGWKSQVREFDKRVLYRRGIEGEVAALEPTRLASSIVLRVVAPGSGKTIVLPSDSSAREQLIELVKCGLHLCHDAEIVNPCDFAYNAIVTRCLPREGVVYGGAHTLVTFDYGSDEDNHIELSSSSASISTSAREAFSSNKSLLELYESLVEPMLLYDSLHESVFAASGAALPKGILLCGPPGVGKTRAMRLVRAEVGKRLPLLVVNINPSTVLGFRYAGETEKMLCESVAQAFEFVTLHQESNGHAILFMDEIEALCPNRKSCSLTQSRIVAQMLTLMDGLDQGKEEKLSHRVVFLAATNQVDLVDPALRRAGRFEREIKFVPPGEEERLQILGSFMDGMEFDQDLLKRLARESVGYVGADLEALAREMQILSGGTGKLESQHVNKALLIMGGASSLRHRKVRIRRGMGNKQSSWDDIGGYEDVKQQLRQAVEWPVMHKDAMEAMGIVPLKGILLHGPPGCSKTTLARAAAESSGCSFIVLSGADVYSPYVGDAELALRNAFADARMAQPAILFLDELDALVGKRGLDGSSNASSSSSTQSRILSTLLNEMDGIDSTSGLFVLAATNRIEMVDEALLRPGRFDRTILVPLPDESTRRTILELHINSILRVEFRTLEEKAGLIQDLAASTQGFSGAELENLVREAAMICLRRDLDDAVTREDLLEALKTCT